MVCLGCAVANSAEVCDSWFLGFMILQNTPNGILTGEGEGEGFQDRCFERSEDQNWISKVLWPKTNANLPPGYPAQDYYFSCLKPCNGT